MAAWDNVFVVGVAAAQALALVGLCWMGFRLDRYLREGQQQATDAARAAAVTLESIQRTQQSLTKSADASTAAATALAKAARKDDSAILSELLGLVRELHERAAAAASAEAVPGDTSPAPDADGRPGVSSADARDLRRLGQLQGEAEELRRRIADRDRQIETLNRDRRRFAHEAAQLSGVKATNDRLMTELKEKRQELRQLQASLDPMHLEVKSLRSQLALLQRQIAGGGVESSRLEGAMAEQTRGVYEERLQELGQRNHTLEDQLRTTRDELVRTRREKAFIEEHYLDLAQA